MLQLVDATPATNAKLFSQYYNSDGIKFNCNRFNNIKLHQNISNEVEVAESSVNTVLPDNATILNILTVLQQHQDIITLNVADPLFILQQIIIVQTVLILDSMDCTIHLNHKNYMLVYLGMQVMVV